MGLSVNTFDTFKYVLEDQRALNEADQRYLVFRYLSARDHAKMEAHFDAALAAENVDVLIDEACKGISLGLVAWNGYADDLQTADALLSRADIMELVRELGSAMTLSQREKKASVLRSLSTSDKSASEIPPKADAPAGA
jgi:hypothetical protein